MAHRHTDWPSHRGEKKLAKDLVSIPDDRLHLFFGISGIPGVRDIDVFIWHEDAGPFVIEVKAVPLKLIKSYSFHSCIFRDRKTTEPPHVQAREACYSLKNYVEPRIKKGLYLTNTVCWPLISREDWNRSWNNEDICGSFSESMIFFEDYNQSPKIFVDRLKRIRSIPPSGLGSSFPFHHNQELFDSFESIIEPNAIKKEEIPSDLERLRILSDFHKRNAVKKVPPKDGHHLLFTGLPGTGKTFLLLQIGLNHAYNGRDVLFVCFNKVLASDIKRILNQSKELRVSPGSIDIYDAFKMLSNYSSDQSCEDDQMAHDHWAKKIVNEIREDEASEPYYDTVLVDEAQDMKQYVFDFIELFARPEATWCVASGGGQELYGLESPWLKQFKKSNKNYRLRRCFRNTQPVFQVAHTFYENAPNLKGIPKTLDKFVDSKTASSQMKFEFDRTEGLPPQLIWIDDQVIGVASDDSFYGICQEDMIVKRYEEIIRDQLSNLKEKEFPIDLLILVPGRRGNPERSYVIDALQKIIAKPPKNINDLEFIDYTIEKKRRQIASRNHVRLCTFHSARGIEAHRVLLFGFEMIDKTIQKQYLKNLGYISLSRSLFELVIAIRISQRTEFICFIEETLNQLQHIKNRPKPVKQSPRSRAGRVSPERKPRSKRSKHRGIKPKKIKTESTNPLMLKNLINDKKTPQRARLEHLKNHITELTSLNKSEWENFAKVIRKKINSPKLRDERDSLLASIRSKVS